MIQRKLWQEWTLILIHACDGRCVMHVSYPASACAVSLTLGICDSHSQTDEWELSALLSLAHLSGMGSDPGRATEKTSPRTYLGEKQAVWVVGNCSRMLTYVLKATFVHRDFPCEYAAVFFWWFDVALSYLVRCWIQQSRESNVANCSMQSASVAVETFWGSVNDTPMTFAGVMTRRCRWVHGN